MVKWCCQKVVTLVMSAFGKSLDHATAKPHLKQFLQSTSQFQHRSRRHSIHHNQPVSIPNDIPQTLHLGAIPDCRTPTSGLAPNSYEHHQNCALTDAPQQRRWVKASREVFWQLVSCVRTAAINSGPICTTRSGFWERLTSHHHSEYVHSLHLPCQQGETWWTVGRRCNG